MSFICWQVLRRLWYSYWFPYPHLYLRCWLRIEKCAVTCKATISNTDKQYFKNNVISIMTNMRLLGGFVKSFGACLLSLEWAFWLFRSVRQPWLLASAGCTGVRKLQPLRHLISPKNSKLSEGARASCQGQNASAHQVATGMARAFTK